MEYLVAKTIVFDRNLAIQARELRRMATEGAPVDCEAETREGVVARVARLIQFRRPDPVAYAECGGAAA